MGWLNLNEDFTMIFDLFPCEICIRIFNPTATELCLWSTKLEAFLNLEIIFAEPERRREEMREEERRRNRKLKRVCEVRAEH